MIVQSFWPRKSYVTSTTLISNVTRYFLTRMYLCAAELPLQRIIYPNTTATGGDSRGLLEHVLGLQLPVCGRIG